MSGGMVYISLQQLFILYVCLCARVCDIFYFFSVTQVSTGATVNDDYVLLTNTISLSGTHEVSVRIVDNNKLENNETFTLQLSNLGDSRILVTGITKITVLIMDDDRKYYIKLQ